MGLIPKFKISTMTAQKRSTEKTILYVKLPRSQSPLLPDATQSRKKKNPRKREFGGN
jgi:hypothetical protein